MICRGIASGLEPNSGPIPTFIFVTKQSAVISLKVHQIYVKNQLKT
jgi:hypothetical protein